jgi:acyl-CoA thioesterase-1
MKPICVHSVLFGLAAGLSLSSCARITNTQVSHMAGESLVFVGEQPSRLAFVPMSESRFALRNSYLPGTNSIRYVEGRDYAVDYSLGTVRRLSGSRIPDFQTNVLFGKSDFDHTHFPGYGNGPFFAFAEYSFVKTSEWPVQRSQKQFLTSTLAKLKTGGEVKIVAFGDSITAGGEACSPSLIFWQRWGSWLEQKYPRAKISAVNGATGGDTTIQGLERLQAKVLNEKPDLLLIAFGMNDHNIGGPTIPQFEQNLTHMVERIRGATGAEVVLMSTFPPNPKWHYGTHRMADYADATSRVAERCGCAYADVFRNWENLTSNKKPEDLLANNINHPNDFGHWIYFQVLTALGL